MKYFKYDNKIVSLDNILKVTKETTTSFDGSPLYFIKIAYKDLEEVNKIYIYENNELQRIFDEIYRKLEDKEG